MGASQLQRRAALSTVWRPQGKQGGHLLLDGQLTAARGSSGELPAALKAPQHARLRQPELHGTGLPVLFVQTLFRQNSSPGADAVTKDNR